MRTGTVRVSGLQLRIDEGHGALHRLTWIGSQGHGDRGADLDRPDIGLGDVGNDPDMRMVGDAVKLVPRHDALAVDDFLLDDVAGRRRRPVDGARIGIGLAHLVDAALRDAEVPQPQHGAFESLVRFRTDPAALRAHCDDQVRLRQLDLRAVEPE